MRVLLIHNPKAGAESHSRTRLEAAIRAAGHEVAYRSVKDDDWRDGLTDRPDLVAIAGGDGTVCEVLDTLAERPAAATILPLGSANNIARTLGYSVDDDPEGLVSAWPNGVRRPCDVWDARGSEDRRFVESMGGGVFAEVLARSQEIDDDSMDKVELGLRLLAEVIDDAPEQTWELSLDGQESRERLLALEAMNVRELGPNLLLAPEAEPGDGMLDVVLVREEHRPQLSAYVAARAAGTDASPPPLEVRRARRVAIRTHGTALVRLDDELLEDVPQGTTLTCEVGARLELLVPTVP